MKFLRNIPYQINSEFALLSDHSVVQLTFWAEPSCADMRPILTSGEMDWDNFRHILTESLKITMSLKTGTEVENAVEFFNHELQRAAWLSSAPRQSRSAYAVYPQYIKNLIAEKQRARKRWYNSRTDKQTYKRLNNLLKTQLKIFRVEKFQELISKLSTDGGSLWRKTKKILRRPVISMPLRSDGGKRRITDQEKAELFADSLENSFKPHPHLVNQPLEAKIAESLTFPLPLYLLPRTIKPSELALHIMRFSRKKAPGYDLITAEVLQQLPRKGVYFLLGFSTLFYA